MRMISERILDKIKGKKVEEKIKEFVKEILDVERKNMFTNYPRYSEDYDKILSRYLRK